MEVHEKLIELAIASTDSPSHAAAALQGAARLIEVREREKLLQAARDYPRTLDALVAYEHRVNGRPAGGGIDSFNAAPAIDDLIQLGLARFKEFRPVEIYRRSVKLGAALAYDKVSEVSIRRTSLANYLLQHHGISI